MTLRKFIQPMPIPELLKPFPSETGRPRYSVTVEEVKHQFHPDLSPAKVWAFNGQLPGPTFEVTKDEAIEVEWKNNLPYDHFLPVDPTLHGAGELPGGRTAIHVHGARVLDEFDGYPDSWFTKNFNETGPTFKHKIYHYPNEQRASTLWYHDHTMGLTRLNMYAGMSGFYVIHDDEERSLQLPQGKYDIPLLLQDRSFHDDGSLKYPKGEDVSSDLDISHVDEAFGDTVIVNGKVWPYFEVEPAVYRFRLLNGANSRYFHLDFQDLPVFQIATDQGLRADSLPIKELLLAPAERSEIVIDFRNSAGQKITITNSAPAAYPDGELEEDMKDVVQFRVGDSTGQSNQKELPKRLTTVLPLQESEAVKTRTLLLNQIEDEYGRPVHVLDGNKWGDPITEDPELNTVEIWNFINVTDDAHPIHLHLVDFHVLDRQPFDLNLYNETEEIKYIGGKKPPERYEIGYKDTVNVNPGDSVRIIARFAPYAGTYVWHCHMIEHEDYDMMRPYKIVDPNNK